MAPHSEPSTSELVDSTLPASDQTISSITSGSTFPRPPTFQDKYAERQYQKERLALGFRIFAKLGFDEGVAGHITLRVSLSFKLLFN